MNWDRVNRENRAIRAERADPVAPSVDSEQRSRHSADRGRTAVTRPKSGLVRVVRGVTPSAPRKPSKAERRAAEARRLGITLDELVERRRREAERAQARNAERLAALQHSVDPGEDDSSPWTAESLRRQGRKWLESEASDCGLLHKGVAQDELIAALLTWYATPWSKALLDRLSAQRLLEVAREWGLDPGAIARRAVTAELLSAMKREP